LALLGLSLASTSLIVGCIVAATRNTNWVVLPVAFSSFLMNQLGLRPEPSPALALFVACLAAGTLLLLDARALARRYATLPSTRLGWSAEARRENRAYWEARKAALATGAARWVRWLEADQVPAWIRNALALGHAGLFNVPQWLGWLVLAAIPGFAVVTVALAPSAVAMVTVVLLVPTAYTPLGQPRVRLPVGRREGFYAELAFLALVTVCGLAFVLLCIGTSHAMVALGEPAVRLVTAMHELGLEDARAKEVPVSLLWLPAIVPPCLWAARMAGSWNAVLALLFIVGGSMGALVFFTVTGHDPLSAMALAPLTMVAILAGAWALGTAAIALRYFRLKLP
jgi:hypothetical protein